MSKPSFDLTKINLGHRFTTANPLNQADCLESIDVAISRALGVIEALAEVELQEEKQSNKWAYWALQAAIMELHDVLAITKALLNPSESKAEKTTENPF